MYRVVGVVSRDKAAESEFSFCRYVGLSPLAVPNGLFLIGCCDELPRLMADRNEDRGRSCSFELRRLPKQVHHSMKIPRP